MRFDARLQVPFPARSFVSMAEFAADAERDAARHAHRARIERAAATTEPELRQESTCGVCLRPATLRSDTLGGPFVAGSALRVPEWPGGQICDCPDRLVGQDRAFLHASLAVGGLRRWSNLLVFGPPQPLHRRLAELAGELLRVPDIGVGHSLAADAACADLLVAIDCLHRAPALRALLAELRRVAASGACLLARFPFRDRAAMTVHRRGTASGPLLSAVEMHAIGWDVLAMARDAGWNHSEMIHYWSRELGYFGARNFLLRALA